MGILFPKYSAFWVFVNRFSRIRVIVILSVATETIPLERGSKVETNWTEWHLTPEGWIPGVTHLINGGAKGNADPPADRCLTCAFEELQENSPGGVKSVVTERWRSDTKQQVEDLMRRFGECPRELHIYPAQGYSGKKCIRIPKAFES